MTMRNGTNTDLAALILAIAPPCIWATHLVVCYFLVSVLGNESNSANRLALTAATAGALAAYAVCASLAMRTNTNPEVMMEQGDPLSFHLKLCLSGAALFAVATILTAMPIYLLRDV